MASFNNIEFQFSSTAEKADAYAQLQWFCYLEFDQREIDRMINSFTEILTELNFNDPTKNAEKIMKTLMHLSSTWSSYLLLISLAKESNIDNPKNFRSHVDHDEKMIMYHENLLNEYPLSKLLKRANLSPINFISIPK